MDAYAPPQASRAPIRPEPVPARSLPQPARSREPADALYELYFIRPRIAGRRTTDAEATEGRLEPGALDRLTEPVNGILASPYATTQDAANEIAEKLRHPAPVRLEDPLVHGGDPRMLDRMLSRFPPGSRLVLVGHSPDLERWIAHLTTGRTDRPFVELARGGACRIDVYELDHEPRAILRWLSTT